MCFRSDENFKGGQFKVMGGAMHLPWTEFDLYFVTIPGSSFLEVYLVFLCVWFFFLITRSIIYFFVIVLQCLISDGQY